MGMKAKELIEYLQGFDGEAEVVIIAANPKQRKKYNGNVFVITDEGQPIMCVEITEESDLDAEESDLDAEEIAAAEQDEREAEQK